MIYSIEPYIALQDTHFRPAMLSKIRLLVYLQYVMQGINYQTISNHFGLGRLTVCKCVHDIFRAILIHLWQAYLHLPSPVEAFQSMHA